MISSLFISFIKQMSSFDISTVKWIVEVIDTMSNDNNRNDDNRSLWLSSINNINNLCNNFYGLLKNELVGKGDVICSNGKKHLISYNESFFTIVLETHSESINFKISQFYD